MPRTAFGKINRNAIGDLASKLTVLELTAASNKKEHNEPPTHSMGTSTGHHRRETHLRRRQLPAARGQLHRSHETGQLGQRSEHRGQCRGYLHASPA